MSKVKVILIIIIFSYIGYCASIQSIRAQYHLGDNEFLNPFLYQEGTIKNSHDYHFDRRADDFRDDVINEEQLQSIKYKKMIKASLYFLLIIIIICAIYFRKLNLKKHEKNNL